MSNPRGTHVCLLATMPASGSYALDNPLNSVPGVGLQEAFSPGCMPLPAPVQIRIAAICAT